MESRNLLIELKQHSVITLFPLGHAKMKESYVISNVD